MRISNRSDKNVIVTWADREASVSGGGRAVTGADCGRPRFVMERYGRTLEPGESLTISFSARSSAGRFVELIDYRGYGKKSYARDGDVTMR